MLRFTQHGFVKSCWKPFLALCVPKQSREAVTVFDKDIGKAMKRACDEPSGELHLYRAAQVIGKDLLKFQTFNGTFIDKCQEDSVPAS